MKSKLLAALLIVSASLTANDSYASLSTSFINFGKVPCGSRQTRSVTFYNTSNQMINNLRASTAGSAFSVMGSCHSIQPSSACTFNVIYWPIQPGTDSGSLWVSGGNINDSASLIGSCYQ